MKVRQVYLRDQEKIHGDISYRIRDTGNKRWTSEEIYRAMNDSLSLWWGKVLIPRLYTGISSWTAGTYAYSLPDYVTAPLVPQAESATSRSGVSYVDGTAETWTDVPGFSLEPDGTGGHDLRFEFPPYSLDARVLYYGNNGLVPVTAPALNAELTTAATSLVLDTVVNDIGRTGYVKVGNEYIEYAGVSDDGSNTTLSNLVRGMYEGVDATHAAATTVKFCVAVDDHRLWQQLYDQMRAYLHELFLTDASSQERSHHERQVSFYQGRADNFWKQYTSGYNPRMLLSNRTALIV